ncbi:HAD-IA family hydrolase [Sphingomonas sp. MMS24-J45]|uniref:HAD-IA family hydrolase n=1 Tax=Sphingomonas sp. MMS24-J45 TaxID=3238806 RepID=UPI003850E8D2
MPIKAIMVDIDGVLLVRPDPGGWSANLERDLGVSAATLQSAFFEPHWDDVVHVRAALRERLEPVLADFAPLLPYRTLIDYWFSNDAHVDSVLLAELAELRAGGTQIHLATVQERERARYLWEDLGFSRASDGLHYTAALGYSKPDPGFCQTIEARTGFRSKDLFFIDDTIANVDAATRCGWAAAMWTGTETLGSLLSGQRQHVR